jgi:hypothetical protein
MESDVWYVGYGSNLSLQRFLCYIQGGKPLFGKKHHVGCADPGLPEDDRPIVIPYSLYFALPDGGKDTENWGPGGVAFISPEKDERALTAGRLWRITRAQYTEVKRKEGPWYRKEIKLGESDGISIYTITHEVELANLIPPSEAYLKTIALGLKETCAWKNEEIANYLVGKKGIKGTLSRHKILQILIGE